MSATCLPNAACGPTSSLTFVLCVLATLLRVSQHLTGESMFSIKYRGLQANPCAAPLFSLVKTGQSVKAVDTQTFCPLVAGAVPRADTVPNLTECVAKDAYTRGVIGLNNPKHPHGHVFFSLSRFCIFLTLTRPPFKIKLLGSIISWDPKSADEIEVFVRTKLLRLIPGNVWRLLYVP